MRLHKPSRADNGSACQRIAFPALYTSGNVLIKTNRDDFIKYCVKRYYVENRYLIKNNANEKLRISWLIDRNGLFREVEIIRYHNWWAMHIIHLIDIVTSECELTAGRSLTVSELLEKLSSLKAPSGFQTAKHLRGYLRRQSPDRVFDATMFREFWDKHGFRLEPEEWLAEYP